MRPPQARESRERRTRQVKQHCPKPDCRAWRAAVPRLSKPPAARSRARNPARAATGCLAERKSPVRRRTRRTTTRLLREQRVGRCTDVGANA